MRVRQTWLLAVIAVVFVGCGTEAPQGRPATKRGAGPPTAPRRPKAGQPSATRRSKASAIHPAQAPATLPVLWWDLSLRDTMEYGLRQDMDVNMGKGGGSRHFRAVQTFPLIVQGRGDFTADVIRDEGVAVAHLVANPKKRRRSKVPSMVFRGMGEDGAFSLLSKTGDEQFLGLLFRLPPKRLRVGEVVEVPARYITKVGLIDATCRGTVLISLRRYVKLDGRLCALIETEVDIDDAVPVLFLGEFAGAVKGKGRIYFDVADRCIARAEGSGRARISVGFATGAKKGGGRGAGPQGFTLSIDTKIALTRRRGSARASTKGKPSRRSRPGAFADAAEFEKRIRRAIALGAGIRAAPEGERFGGMAPVHYIRWTYALVGLDAPARLEALSRAGRKIERMDDLRAGDVVFFRRGEGTAPSNAGLYDGRGKVAFLPAPGGSEANWQRTSVRHRALLGRFLFARRLWQRGL